MILIGCVQHLSDRSVSSPGYQQANVVVLPRRMADDFEDFCRSNPAPLPLLYRSQSGETSCEPLAKHADIRLVRMKDHLLLLYIQQRF